MIDLTDSGELLFLADASEWATDAERTERIIGTLMTEIEQRKSAVRRLEAEIKRTNEAFSGLAEEHELWIFRPWWRRFLGLGPRKGLLPRGGGR